MQYFLRRLFTVLLFYLTIAGGEGDALSLVPDTTGYDVVWYFLQLEVSDTSVCLSGSAEVDARVVADTLEVFVLDLSEKMQVATVEAEQPVRWERRGDRLFIFPERPWHRGEMVVVRVVYGGCPERTFLFSGVHHGADEVTGQQVTWTLSEPWAAREWFPCKQVLADKADSVALWLTTAPGVVAGANGLLTGVDTLEGGRLRYRWHHRHPIAYYLPGFAASRYRVVDLHAPDIPGPHDSLLVRNFLYADTSWLNDHRDELAMSIPLLQLFSRLFGTYPYADEKYGHILAPMGGGMEHQTLTTLSNLNFLLMAHEMAHQWFGDLVTCATWQDIWVNEGFASYGEYLAVEHLQGDEEAAGWMRQAQQLAREAPGGSVYVPPAERDDLERIFSMPLSYKKGAVLIHMIRHELDDDTLFFRFLRSFLQEYRDSVAAGRDVERVLEEVSGRDFGWFFDQWYYGQGYPLLSVLWWQREDTLMVEVRQTPSGATPFFRISLDLLLGRECGDTVVKVRMTMPQQRFTFSVRGVVRSLHVDPRGWLLKEITSISHVVDGTAAGEVVLFPNPAREKVTLFGDVNGPVTIILNDLQGRVIMTRHGVLLPVTIDLSGQVGGLYILHITGKYRSWTRRLVIGGQ